MTSLDNYICHNCGEHFQGEVGEDGLVVCQKCGEVDCEPEFPSGEVQTESSSLANSVFSSPISKPITKVFQSYQITKDGYICNKWICIADSQKLDELGDLKHLESYEKIASLNPLNSEGFTSSNGHYGIISIDNVFHRSRIKGY